MSNRTIVALADLASVGGYLSGLATACRLFGHDAVLLSPDDAEYLSRRILDALAVVTDALKAAEPSRDDTDDEYNTGTCQTCGNPLKLVRPGRWQCPLCG